MCINTPGSFTCACADGWEGDPTMGCFKKIDYWKKVTIGVSVGLATLCLIAIIVIIVLVVRRKSPGTYDKEIADYVYSETHPSPSSTGNINLPRAHISAKSPKDSAAADDRYDKRRSDETGHVGSSHHDNPAYGRVNENDNVFF
ncbi:PREDICTED: uncharacterized protein LOC106818496 [Priapulus caudatus]|uniref:Uncharacterized protein LOC106818496 n=1 Tax=Priapulus caudatus TaxID=37621 RepID=A0ABM1F2L0_PRICU|nr:PREDICTED: uncharacterized protein LOC106818496 [Priapulus caudatus]